MDLLAQLILIAQDNYYDLKFYRLNSDMKIINLCGKAANWKIILADCLIIKERDHWTPKFLKQNGRISII